MTSTCSLAEPTWNCPSTRDAGVGGNLDVLVLQGLESRALDSDRVDIGDQVRHRVVATLVRGVVGR